MRAKTMGLVAAIALAAAALTGCTPTAPASSTLTVHGDSATTSVKLTEVQCVTSPDKFTSSATDRVGELPAFVATLTTSTKRSVTWLHLDDDRWFMTTEAFGHDGATVTFDAAKGRIGTSASGYPTQFDGSGTLDGTVTCTSVKKI